MRIQPFVLAFALLLTTPVAPAAAFFGPDENQIYATHDGTLGTIDAALIQGDARQVEMGLKELLDRMEDQLSDGELKLPLRAEYHARLLKLRTAALRQGITPGNWARWAQFDGFPQAPKDDLAKQVDQLTYYPGDMVGRLPEAKELRAQLAASKDPMHTFAREHVLEPAIAGVQVFQARDKSEFAVDRLTRILTSEPMPNGEALDDELVRVREAVKAIRAAGVDPATVKVSLEGRTLNVLQALKEAEPIAAAAVKKREAAEKAQQAKLVRYRKLLKGDKARLFDREGMPEWWSANKATPETMATATTWRYRITEGNGYYFVYYLFDRNDKLVRRNVEKQ